MNAVVVGAGSWGTAFARLLADRGHYVTLAARDEAQAAAIAESGRNPRYLTHVDISDVHATTVARAPYDAADVIVLAPSNPYVSLGPILAVAEIRAALERRRVPAVAVSPLVGGRAVRGPADRMLARLAGGTTPAHVASCYAGLIDALVLDESDAEHAADLDVRPIVTRTLMVDADARRRLAEAALEVAAAPR